MIIETFLDASHLTKNQTLVIVDENGKQWDVVEALASSQETPANSNTNELILERWQVELGEPLADFPPDLGSILPTVYKKSIVLFRSLFTYSKLLPVYKLAKRSGKTPAKALKVRFRIREAGSPLSEPRSDSLITPLYPGSGSVNQILEEYSFGTTESPAGLFSVKVTYRVNCNFRVDDAEAILSSQFMGADDHYFRPSLPLEETSKLIGQEAGSLPLSRRGMDSPDRSRAYGSLSTFHQVGPTNGASPISTLRAARELGTTSPSPPASPPQRLLPSAKISSLGRAALTGTDEGANTLRRPSISFQPFKAPPLSASPSLVDAPLSASPRVGVTGPLSMGASAAARKTPPIGPSVGQRKTLLTTAEQASPSSTSASPKGAPISRYSSSFSHRRGRLSSGGPIKADEDNNSSGKGSTASSNAQPGSGILAEVTGTSADSLHADDENISDFLKMLDTKKDLLNPVKAAAVDAATRRTSAALNRFRRMRDSNAALSDSMSSSLFLNRSSTTSSSRQLASVPPMVTGTSTSTASSPGKQISPHTPHTPAIPSRLSSNSIVSYNDPSTGRSRRRSNLDRESPADDTASEETELSTFDIRRGSGYRTASGRHVAPQTTAFDEEEPLLFAMSDFGASRRSLEEGRRGSVSNESGGTSGGSRRGSGRRGGGIPSFHAWQ